MLQDWPGKLPSFRCSIRPRILYQFDGACECDGPSIMYWVPALPGCYSQGETIEEDLVIGRVKVEVAGVGSAT